MSDSNDSGKHNPGISELLEADYPRLLRFIRRQLNEYVIAETTPVGALDPRDIVDRVAEDVLKHPGLKPHEMDEHTWFLSLAYRQTRKAVRRYLDECDREVPVDLDIEADLEPVSPDDLEPEEFRLNLLLEAIEPTEETQADYIPDPQSRPPDVTAAEEELVSALRSLARRWPKMEREIFEMHYLEGMGAEDIATTLGCAVTKVNHQIARIQNTLRRRLVQITDGMLSA